MCRIFLSSYRFYVVDIGERVRLERYLSIRVLRYGIRQCGISINDSTVLENF